MGHRAVSRPDNLKCREDDRSVRRLVGRTPQHRDPGPPIEPASLLDLAEATKTDGNFGPTKDVEPKRKRVSRGRRRAPSATNAEIRACARDHGMSVSGRGRIPGAVVTAYREAQAR